jgi:Ala-tRNA(Pro) deacylase
LKEVTGATEIELAREDEFMDLFPDFEVGAMPPFGNLYGLDVYVAESLAEDEVIAFNAGTHTDLIKMAFGTFARLVKPKILRFSTRH